MFIYTFSNHHTMRSNFSVSNIAGNLSEPFFPHGRNCPEVICDDDSRCIQQVSMNIPLSWRSMRGIPTRHFFLITFLKRHCDTGREKAAPAFSYRYEVLSKPLGPGYYFPCQDISWHNAEKRYRLKWIFLFPHVQLLLHFFKRNKVLP